MRRFATYGLPICRTATHGAAEGGGPRQADPDEWGRGAPCEIFKNPEMVLPFQSGGNGLDNFSKYQNGAAN
jgi:hypothetical protein